jgi:hypothetical protein
MTLDTSWVEDPLKFKDLCWPDVKFYDKQVEIIKSVRDNDETIVPAGNKLGKDFVAGFIALWWFCSRTPVKVVTTSAGQGQMKAVLWGEIRRFINTSKYPLPIQVNELFLRQTTPDGGVDPISYMLGITTNVEENLLGHHLMSDKPRTLIIFDEASSIEDKYYEASDTWAHRKLVIGNPLPCVNFFFKSTEEGDILRDPAKPEKGYYRKIIRIRADESPNVKLGFAEEALGKEPSNRNIVPGVIDYFLYKKRRQLWDPIRQTIGLDAEFYKGSEVLMYPPPWMEASHNYAATLDARRRSNLMTMGVDPGEGEADTVWCVGDINGIVAMYREKSHDTSDIPGKTIAYMLAHGVLPENVLFDRGGGGKQHADALRKKGYLVRSVGFGEAVTDPKLFRRMVTSKQKLANAEQRYVYKNRRAEMYGLLRNLLWPTKDADEKLISSFGIPREYTELRKQLAPVPLLYDGEGRIYLPPKSKPTPDYKGVTMIDILGCSPDHSDAAVLMVYGLVTQSKPAVAGGIV